MRGISISFKEAFGEKEYLFAQEKIKFRKEYLWCPLISFLTMSNIYERVTIHHDPKLIDNDGDNEQINQLETESIDFITEVVKKKYDINIANQILDSWKAYICL